MSEGLRIGQDVFLHGSTFEIIIERGSSKEMRQVSFVLFVVGTNVLKKRLLDWLRYVTHTFFRFDQQDDLVPCASS